MNNSTKKLSISFILVIFISAILLAGCQETPTKPTAKTPERPNPNIETRPDEEVLPTLQLVENGQTSKIVLRSQTSHLNSEKNTLEIDLTSSKVAFCKNEHPELSGKEEELIITLKAKDPKTTLGKGEYLPGKDYEISAIRRNAAGQTNLPGDAFKSLKITDINNAIVRGSLDIATENLSISGEYFTAICK